MLHEWERQYPGRSDNMLRAMAHVTRSHLMDRNLYPFATLKATGVSDPAGDKAFDDDPCADPAEGRNVRLDLERSVEQKD
jgi:tRNA 2-thiocytidine biosynthesis protein TtcA